MRFLSLLICEFIAKYYVNLFFYHIQKIIKTQLSLS